LILFKHAHKGFPAFEVFPLREIENVSINIFKNKQYLFFSLFLLILGIIFLIINNFFIPIVQGIHGSDNFTSLVTIMIFGLQLLPILSFIFSAWNFYLFLKREKSISLQLHKMKILMKAKPKLLGIRMENILFFKGSGTNLRLESKLKSIEELYGFFKDFI